MLTGWLALSGAECIARNAGATLNSAVHRYGYGSAEFYYQILEGYANASIPLDTFVSDSQYMDHDQEFTLGSTFNMSEMQVRSIPGLRFQGMTLIPEVPAMLVCWTQRDPLPSPWCICACDPKSTSLCRKGLSSGVCGCNDACWQL